MPNIKSAKKRVKVIATKTLQNIIYKSKLKTSIKKCKEAVSKNDSSLMESFKTAIKTIDKAAAKNLIHKNNAARKKSQLTKAFNLALASQK